jgi:hypothetical protein
MFRSTFARSVKIRRLLGAFALGAGVYLVAVPLRGTVPRDVEVHVRLDGYPSPVHAVDVTFSRGSEALRALHRDYHGAAPAVFRSVVALPEGPLRALVRVTLDGVVLERSVSVSIVPGEALPLPAPAPP